MKSAVIYWSQTGNTKLMAEALAKGMSAELFEVSAITSNQALKYDFIALGCPAMGSEALEDDHFEPFIEELYKKIRGKKIALFGSYGWGDGEYMEIWQERTQKAGAQLFKDGLTVNGIPEPQDIQNLEQYGREFIAK